MLRWHQGEICHLRLRNFLVTVELPAVSTVSFQTIDMLVKSMEDHFGSMVWAIKGTCACEIRSEKVGVPLSLPQLTDSSRRRENVLF